MKLKPMGRAAKASMLSLSLALGVSACSNDYTVAYVYMTTAKTLPHGLINSYQVDYQSGHLLPMPDSPIDAGGRDTVALVVAPNNLFLYTVNNFDSDVTEFAIGTDGKLYPQFTSNVMGSLPTAAAVDAAGKFLYVAYTYQNNPPSPGYPSGSELYTPANPGPGGISIFPINANNTLGAPISVNAGRNPVGIATSPLQVAKGTSGCAPVSGNYCTEVWLIEQDSATAANLLGYLEDPSTGALTPLPGVTLSAGNVPSTGFALGTLPNGTTMGFSPSGILVSPSGTNLYVADQAANGVTPLYVGSNGIPSATVSAGSAKGTLLAPVATDAGPMGMAFDLNTNFLYVTAYTANAIDGFNLGAGGQPTRSSVSGVVQTGTGPTCIAVGGAPSNSDPSHAVYLYSSNSLNNSVTGEQLNEQNGSLDQIVDSPFSGSALPTCIAIVPAFPLRSY